MWDVQSEQLGDGRGTKAAIHSESSPVSYRDVLRLWQEDADFRSLFTRHLADLPYATFRWETPPVTVQTASRPFEFVVLDSPGLARSSNPRAFAEHFSDEAEGGVVEFENLGGDAIMVVPCPIAPPSAYGHLGSFVRAAPEAQQHALWQRVGRAMSRRLADKPLWLSTAGAGVSWLHIRLDDQPKYYGYAPYRESPR